MRPAEPAAYSAQGRNFRHADYGGDMSAPRTGQTSLEIEDAGDLAAHPPQLLFPSTRYQGSKLKLLPWLAHHFTRRDFHSALDAFGGTGVVSYLLRTLGKSVAFNDHLEANAVMARALIQNPGVRLEEADIEFLLERHRTLPYDNFIERTFDDIYFTREENAWLDQLAQNIPLLESPWKRALAYYALFQACLIKRPYNLFHRKNLYIRLAQVERSFGNKTSWETPFTDHFRRFAHAANRAVFDDPSPVQVFCRDARNIPGSYDLVYLDPPYLNQRGTGVDYFAFYHFLEGLLSYSTWFNRLDERRKHLPLRGVRSDWSHRETTHEAFAALFSRYQDTITMLSYRDNGIPSRDELGELLSKYYKSVEVHEFGHFQYVLSNDRTSRELLFVAS